MGAETHSNEELAALAKQGGESAKMQLWEQIKPFVRYKARRCLPNDGGTARCDIDDLTQSGYIAMMGAVEGFDPDAGRSFVSYFALHLKTEFAQVLGIRTSKRDALLQALTLDAPWGNEDTGLTLADTLEAPKHGYGSIEDAAERMEQAELFDTIMQCVKRLNPSQQAAITLTYIDGLTYQATALKMGVGREKARSLQAKGLRALRGFSEIKAMRREFCADQKTDFYLHIGLDAFQSGAGSAVENLAEKRFKKYWWH